MSFFIADIDKMSESSEYLSSGPRHIVTFFIYFLLGILIIVFLWMSLFEIDIKVKSTGVIKCSDSIYEVSSSVNGEVIECCVDDGDYVNQGDILYILDSSQLKEEASVYKGKLHDINDKMVMLEAYIDSLEHGTSLSMENQLNPYYKEYLIKWDLVNNKIKANSKEIQSNNEYYQNAIETINSVKSEYQSRINDLKNIKENILERKNSFNENNVYYSMINSYITNYEYYEKQYDVKISDLKQQLAAIDNKNDEEYKEEIEKSIKQTEEEKHNYLNSLESSKLYEIDQQINSLNDTITSLNTELITVKQSLNNNDSTVLSKETIVLQEKLEIEDNILICKEKKKEYEAYLNENTKLQRNCSIEAISSGYFYSNTRIEEGTFFQEGLSVGQIYPSKETSFYGEIYVKNSDVGKIKVGQKVKFDVYALNSNEYSSIAGIVTNVSKVALFDETENSYYLVKATCEKNYLADKSGEIYYLKNGMQCDAVIITDSERLLVYLLNKIHLMN